MRDENFRPRVEGRSKVTGTARFVGDIRADVLGSSFDTAVVVTSTRSSGVVSHIDPSAALAVPGVKFVMTHENAPRLKKAFALANGEIGSFLPLQDNRIRYYGQCIAVVVAESLEAAQEGARLVAVTYGEVAEPRAYSLGTAASRLKFVKRAGIVPGKIAVGDALKDFDAAPVKIDLQFDVAPAHHNAIEPSAVIARWDPDGGITVHAAIQWHHSEALVLGQVFGLSAVDRLPGLLGRMMGGAQWSGKVRLVNAISGGSFGRNQNPVHMLLAAMAAKICDRAVKVVLSREQTYSLLSYRAQTRQRLRLGARVDGTVTTIVQDADVAKGTHGSFIEPVGEGAGKVYGQSSLLIRHRVAELDLNGAGWMRAPGVSVSFFALESSMDVLAHQLGVDPLDLRLRNYSELDQENKRAWTSKSLRRCYEAGAAAIGWRTRSKGGQLDENGRWVGFGMATSFHPNRQFPATARLSLRRDGTAEVALAIADMGQGIFTALTKIAAEALGLPRDSIILRTQDTDLPAGAGSFGSSATLSNGAAIVEAAAEIQKRLIESAVRDKASSLFGQSVANITVSDGQLAGVGGAKDSVAAVMGRHASGVITAKATTGRTLGYSKLSKGSFGAIFAQVSVDPITLRVRVEKLVGAFACGRIIDKTIAANQLAGGMIWGLGQALMEETQVDPRTGQWVNANLAEALIATNADVPPVDVILIDEDDTRFHSLGSKGLGEIGLVGPAPAIANAIFDATGKRLLSLPIRIEHLMGEKAVHPVPADFDKGG